MAKELKLDSQIQKAVKDTTKTTAFPITGFNGLELNIRVSERTGNKTANFRHRYTHPITGKRPYMSLGDYPAFTLEQARQAYNDNLALLAKGIDPLENKENLKQQEITDRKNTVQHFINEWKAIQQSKPLSKSTIRNYRNWVAPIEKHLAQRRVTDLKAKDIIAFIKTIQKEYPDKGIKVKGILKAVLQLAKAEGVIEYNPASDLKTSLTQRKRKHLPSITTPAEFAKLLNDIDSLPATADYRKEVLQILALTFARVGDVCTMKWADINLFTKQWEFRPQKAGGRDDMSDLITPLAPQAVAILKRMREITGGQEYVFYNPTRRKGSFSDPEQIRNTLNSPLMNEGRGYKGIHSPHGFRASAKTMLMERLGYDELITELQLGHRMLNQYGKAYSRMDMLQQRRAMLTDWADYLDDLRAGKIDNVIHFTPAKQQKAVNHE